MYSTISLVWMRRLCLFVFITTGAAFGISQAGFNQTIDNDGSLRLLGVATVDEMLVVSGISRKAGSLQNGFVAGMDTSGSVIWMAEIADDSSHITMSEEVRMCVTDNRIVQAFTYFNRPSLGVMSVDFEGNVGFLQEYRRDSATVNSGLDIIGLPDGYLITGWTSGPPTYDRDAFILKTDLEGNELWFRTYGNAEYDEIGRTVSIGLDGEIIISGIQWADGSAYGWAQGVDSNGMETWKWEGRLEAPGHRGILSVLPDSVKSRCVYLSKLEKSVYSEDLGFEIDMEIPAFVTCDYNMNVISTVVFGPYAYRHHLGRIIESRDGGYIASGNFSCFTEDSPVNCDIGYGKVIKTDANGTEIWSVVDTAFYTEKIGSRCFLSNITEAESGSIYSVGWADKHDDEGIYRSFGWLLKITADGCIDTLCMPTSIEDLKQPDRQLFNVYPNPCTEYLQIDLVGTGSGTFDVSIMDPLGNLVNSERRILPGRLNTGSMPAGVYYYSVTDENKTVGFGKFLKVE